MHEFTVLLLILNGRILLNTLLSYRITNYSKFHCPLAGFLYTSEPVLHIKSFYRLKQAVIDEPLRSKKAGKVNFKVLVYISLQFYEVYQILHTVIILVKTLNDFYM